MRRFLAMLLTVLPVFWAADARAQQLIMFEEHGCIWCERWNKEIGPIYPKTAEGARAPLRRLDVHAPLPKDVELTRDAFYTPTFVLIVDGQEVGRIEGYPGEDFFWGLLAKMLEDFTDFKGAS